MAAVLELIIRGRDELSGPMGKAQVSLGSLVKAGAVAAVGFGGMEAAMQGAKTVIVNSIGAAAAYERQMAQIRALTGATAEDTDILKSSIREMQRTLPKSSKELGAGAYFILSSGITDAADAADVLKIAAKASTVGLGDTAVVADALTTVLNAYQMEAGKAGRVTDVLMQAVKDGKAEADAFAGVLGTVVPIASQMGISFEEVAANLATFTRLGVSAEEAATGLRGVMSQLLSPGEEAKKVLGQLGLSFQELRAQIREKGLMAVLQELMQRFQGNEEALGKLFPDIRGLTNVLATAGVQGDAYAEILGNMATATGNLEKGFEEVSDTAQFKMQKAMNDLNVELEELGSHSLPGIVVGLDLVSKALALASVPGEAWIDLQRTTIEDLRGLNEETAGLQITVGETTNEIDRMKRRAAEMAGALAEAEANADTLDPVLSGLAKQIKDVGDEADAARTKLFAMFKEPTKEELVAEAALASLELAASKITDQMGPATAAAKEYADGLEDQGVAASVAEGLSRGLTQAEAERLRQLTDSLIPEQEDHLDVLRLQRDALAATTEANYTTAGSYDALAGKTAAATDEIDTLSGRQAGMQTEMDNYRQIISGVGAAFQGVIDRGPAVSGSIDSIFHSAQASKEAFMGNVTTVDTLLRHLESIPKTFSTSWNIKAMVTVQGLQVTAEQKALLSGAIGMQHGGIIPPGVVMPAILHGPEAVIPLNRMPASGAGGGMTLVLQPGAIVFNGSDFRDPVEFERVADRLMGALQRRMRMR